MIMKRYTLAGFLIVACLFAYYGIRIFCLSKEVKVDSWYREATVQFDDDFNPVGWKRVDSQLISLTKPEYKSDCEKLLEQESWMRLSKEQAQRFTGKPISVKDKRYPYLIRGVYLLLQAPNYPGSTGGFKVLIKQRNVWIAQGAWGRRTFEMKRQPIVVMLDSDPAQVFVTTNLTV